MSQLLLCLVLLTTPSGARSPRRVICLIPNLMARTAAFTRGAEAFDKATADYGKRRYAEAARGEQGPVIYVEAAQDAKTAPPTVGVPPRRRPSVALRRGDRVGAVSDFDRTQGQHVGSVESEPKPARLTRGAPARPESAKRLRRPSAQGLLRGQRLSEPAALLCLALLTTPRAEFEAAAEKDSVHAVELKAAGAALTHRPCQ